MRFIYRGIAYESTPPPDERPDLGLSRQRNRERLDGLESVKIPNSLIRLSYRGTPYIKFR